MAEIQPFRGLRYTAKAGELKDLTCPPYDVVSEEQRQAYLAKNPYNVIRLELPKGEDPYGAAGRTLQEWLEEGILKQDTEPALYMYEEEFTAYGEKKKVKGLICRVKLEEFSKGVVLPHEETLSKAKEDRFRLMQSTFCNFSQIYSLYRDEAHTTLSRVDLLSRDTPRYEFDDGQVIHRLWVVNDKAVIAAIQEDFAARIVRWLRSKAWICVTISWVSPRIFLAYSTAICPLAFSSILFLCRTNSGTCSSASSLCMDLLKDGCDRCICSAAPDKVPRSATANSCSSWYISIKRYRLLPFLIIA